ncbi:MAG: hypothetical protein R2942_08695 [Ignavibacteria bacterium]
MRIFILIFISLIFYSCTSSIAPDEYVRSPCVDITYQKLLKMEIKKMSNSELEYFKKMDKECNSYMDEHNGPESEKTEAKKEYDVDSVWTRLVLDRRGYYFLFVFKKTGTKSLYDVQH